ncbi:MAG: von Willebrand factor type A domain-containing protein, partial [Flavobacteriales bacterium]
GGGYYGRTVSQSTVFSSCRTYSSTLAAGNETQKSGALVTDTAFNTESYNKITDNPFRKPVDDPLSTFSVDVDNASYSNVRNRLQNDQLPEVDAVRIEEFINYFDYSYPQPVDEKPFSVNTAYVACPWTKDHTILKIGLQGKNIPTEKLPPSNLVFLLDVSGSMNDPNRLPLVKKSLISMLDYLGADDRVAIVVYAGAAGLVLPSTSCADKEKIKDALDKLEAGGSTAGGAGIHLAYEIASKNFNPEGNNRVILATDGDFNVGVSSDAEMTRLIEEKRKTGIYITVLGFGMGNLKDSKMETIADNGNGNYFYIDSKKEGERVLGSNLAGTLVTIANDVKIQVEFNPRKVAAYRLIGYENRVLNKEDFNNDKKDAGDIGAGHSVTALYEIIPAGEDKTTIDSLTDVDGLKYQRTRLSTTAFTSNEIATVKLRYKTPSDSTSQLIKRDVENVVNQSTAADDNFVMAVAAFGMQLRNSPYKGNINYTLIKNLAEKGKGKNEDRKEFIELVEKAEKLAEKKKKEAEKENEKK